MERLPDVDSYKEAADVYEAYKDFIINLADLEKDIVNTVCQIAEIRAGVGGYDTFLDMIDDERISLHDRLCDLYSKKYKELPPDEQARIAYNQAVNRKKEADEKEREAAGADDGGDDNNDMRGQITFYQGNITSIIEKLANIKSGYPKDAKLTGKDYMMALSREYEDLSEEFKRLKEAKEPVDSPDAETVRDLREMVRDAAKTLEIALFGNLDEMTDKEKAAALEDIHSGLMAELYGGGVDPEKVEAAEKEMKQLKAAAELPFV